MRLLARFNLSLQSVTFIPILALACMLGLAGFVRIIPTLLQIPAQLDFGAYYVAGRKLNAQMSPYSSNPLDEAALGVAEIPHTGYIYPPFFAAMMRPLALLPYRFAESVWFFGNVLLFGLLWIFTLRFFGFSRRWMVLLTPIGMLLPATYDTWLLGQVSILLSALVFGSLMLATRKQSSLATELTAGALLGIAIGIKFYPILLGAVYLRYQRWNVLLGVGISVIITFAIGIIFGGGWETTWYWFISVLPGASAMAPFPSNQSLRGVVARFFTEYTFQVPVLTKDNFMNVALTPLLNSPIISPVIVGLGSAVIICITAWRVLRYSTHPQRETLTLDMAIGTVAMLLITPVVWDFYYVHLLLPLALLGVQARFNRKLRLVFSCIILLLILQRYWRYLILYAQSPWLMIFGFLAVFILWIILLMLRSRTEYVHSLD